MRSLYESVDRKRRALEHHRNALECEKAGYPGLATVNKEIAAMLEWEPVERYER